VETTASETGGWLQLVLLGVFLIIAILFLLTEQNTLRTIKNENRRIRPGQVWLQMIPIFGQIWQFIVVVRIAGSIRNEVASWENDSILGIEAAAIAQGNKRPTQAIGIAYCTLIVIGVGLNPVLWGNPKVPIGLIELIGWTELAGIICWIVYWVKLAGYKRRLREKNLATL